MNQLEFKNISSGIPNLPGVYKYFDIKDKLIYVGKAKNLKKRVSSYFSKTIVNQKTNELVKKINKIEFTIVDSEEDACAFFNIPYPPEVPTMGLPIQLQDPEIITE